MWPYSLTHVGTPSHLGHMDRVAATMPSQAHAGAAQEAPNIGQWEGQDVPLVRPSSCTVKGGIPSSRRYLPTYLVVPVPPSPFFRAGLLALFFFQRGVCLHVSVSLFPVGRCSWLGVAGFDWVVPLCLFGGPVFGAFWVGGLAASCGVGGRFGGCGLFSRPPPPPPPVFFFWGGGVPVPPSAFPGLAHALARIQCGLPGCCWGLRSAWPCSGPMGQVGYVHVGLGAPSCRVRSWLCWLGGCARRLRVALG